MAFGFDEKPMFSELIEESVIAFYASDNHEDIAFVTQSGKIYRFHCEGDCCSVSWVEHATGLKHLIHAKVTKIIEKPKIGDINEDGIMDDRGEAVDLWGYTIVTSKGYFDLELRNASNGYYGGWVERAGADVMGLTPIESDF